MSSLISLSVVLWFSTCSFYTFYYIYFKYLYFGVLLKMELKNFNLRLLVAGIKKHHLYLCNQPCQTPDFVLVPLFGRFIKIFYIEDHVVCKVSPIPFQYVCLTFLLPYYCSLYLEYSGA